MTSATPNCPSMEDISESLTALPERAKNRWIVAFFLLSLVWCLWGVTRGWNNQLSDRHGFRQSQTALTSYYMIHGNSSFLEYETPTFGAPWSVPFEFPLYQWIVAKTSMSLAIPLNQAGRLVSLIFFAGTLLIFAAVLGELQVPPPQRLVFLSLVLVSPLYIFWSRSFMIESTALCFCMAYLWGILHYLRCKDMPSLFLAALCGALGALIKITTFPGFLLAGCVIYFLRERKTFWSLPAWRYHVVAGLALAAVPIFAGVLWTHHADRLKALNAIGAQLASGNVHNWIFGSTSQKLSLETWKLIVVRTTRHLLGHQGAIALLILAFLYMERLRQHLLISCLLFLAVPVAFTNLHFVHEYYPYSNGIFLLAAFGWAIVSLIQGQGSRPFVGVLLLGACLVSSGYRYYREFYPMLRRDFGYWYDDPFDRKLITTIKDRTRREDVLFVVGLDYSSEIPYYSERRSVAWNFDNDPQSPLLQTTIERLKGYHIGGVVFNNETDSKLINALVKQLNLSPSPIYNDKACQLYISPFSSDGGTPATRVKE